ncbi:MAG TPA: succinate dehydrogenase/fumarate reductase iron-sulfur subunit [Candidatus Tectomicrobia bacterium]|jgi:succinate dehydrogenase / fumarate reductase iron-sulfur subunit
MAEATLQVFRGTKEGGLYQSYTVPVYEGMVVLDAIHHIQATYANDLAVRWNCKAGKCGSCSAEVNGRPRLMCMTRMDQYPAGEPIRVDPMRRFPLVRDLVTDVSWNYGVNKRIKPFTPKPREADGTYRMQQYDIDRIQEFHKCIECFLCQDVCHVLRDHGKHDFAGPRFMVRIAALAMHPLDTVERTAELKNAFGVEYCNITKCCTEVCPEDIHITDNAIIPLKERVAGAFYDPLAWLWRAIRGKQTQRA